MSGSISQCHAPSRWDYIRGTLPSVSTWPSGLHTARRLPLPTTFRRIEMNNGRSTIACEIYSQVPTDTGFIRLKHGAIDWLAKNRNRDILRLLSVRPNRSNIRRHVGEHGSSVAAAVRREPKAAANQASPRFATVCVEGRPAGKCRTDPSTSRLKLLNTILQEINEQWSKLDAIVLPGGYRRLNQNIGHLPFADRVRALDAAGFVEPIKNAIKLLSRSPNTCLVFGVDGPKNGDGGDELCVAANRTGIVGIGRKIFPTKEEADGLQCSMQILMIRTVLSSLHAAERPYSAPAMTCSGLQIEAT